MKKVSMYSSSGLGLPNEMADYITGEDPVCPYLYLWNPADMGSYEIQPCLDGGSEVIVGPPIKFDAENIESWKETFQKRMPVQGQ
ncbi:hypothetical protein [Diplocloster modestus]|uniref:Uncharacterized protein n=1 Tax=Diplocloster modestus TaxID=2850322 RepID=A0ABS6KC84_9FIRM|nr:hypothetical protein [Diplocloster modestus]MBU9728108.1 hypothetical protein [Diplocloster modestus]